ncbi:MAG: hypothetical protein A3F67_01250 [Verrucomicrobia bacterium RIFCSPHIGHO2_12_FULL_41_10]|nr:MAG: hypothetical protein A3F67_01250 [Verrucomicrobia bacterium RIFCSPHIGHO2_12_FULL_41_10]
MLIKNSWYIACRAHELKKAPLYRRIAEQSIVLFRDENDRASALIDRCCHRGVPLSKGFVKNGCITCPYHGWQFNRTGQCVHIPELDTVGQTIPKKAKVNFFPTVEKDGFIWIFTGANELAIDVEIPPFPFFHDPKGWGCSYNSVETACDWLHMAENILDGAHLPFIHEKSLDNGSRFSFQCSRKFRREKKSTGHPPKILETEMTEKGFIAFAENQEEKLGFRFNVHLPSTVLIELDFGPRKVRVWIHIVPTDKGACRIEHVFCRNFLTSRWLNPLFKKVGGKFLKEDIEIVSKQPFYRKEAGAWEVSTLRDKVPLLLRSAVYKLKAKEEEVILKQPEESVSQSTCVFS